MSDPAIEIFKNLAAQFEGRRKQTYLDQAGIPTIGIGHVGHEVIRGLVWTDEQIDDAFAKDASEAIEFAHTYTSLIENLSPGTRAAIYDFIFNAGCGAYKNSTFRKDVNANDLEAAKQSIMLWDKITVDGRKVRSLGLQRRRAAERDLIGK
jgi:lysozyme